jgi:hypothetical protein
MNQQKHAETQAESLTEPLARSSEEPLGTAAAVRKPAGRGKPQLKPQVQDHIGRQLRAVYDDVLKQPLPDRFRELMEKLDQTSGDSE